MMALLFAVAAVLCMCSSDAYTLQSHSSHPRVCALARVLNRGHHEHETHKTHAHEPRLYRLHPLYAKKKGKPKGPQTALPPAPKASSGAGAIPVPRRVKADSNVSVRKQISWAKAYKRFQSNTSSNLGV
jgi:hypothetical protein